MKFVEEMNDLEAIEYCIEMGIEEAHKLLKTYRKNDRFTNSKSWNSLQKLLTTIHEDVHLAINPKNNKPFGGQKRRHVVGALRDEAIPKEDKRTENREGQPPSEEIILMSEHIHNKLYAMYLQDKHMEFGLNSWTEQLGFIDIDDNTMKHLEKRISEVHRNSSFHVFKPSEVVRYFKDAIYKMSTGVVEKSFNVLSKLGKIEYIKHFNVVKVDNKKEIVEESEYDEISKARMDLLKEMGSSISEYNLAINNPSPSKREKEIRTAVSDMLAKDFDCNLIYKSYQVISVVLPTKSDIVIGDFMDAYWNDFIRRTERRQSLYDKDYGKDETWLWRKLWCFHTLFFIEYMGHDTAGLLLEYEMQNLKRIRELSDAYQAWQDKDKPKFAWGITDKEDSDEEIDEQLEDLL